MELKVMFKWLRDYLYFLYRCIVLSFKGNNVFYAWMTFLTALTLIGLNAYCKQFVKGLYVTGMSDQTSWGLYIANFTYLVGMAAAAVMIVIPVYIYKNRDLDDVVIFAELFAIVTIMMCVLFVMVDLGRPDRILHLMPFVGRLNFPASMLSWDVLVLNVYLLINLHVCGYLLYMRYLNRKPSQILYIPFIFISMFWAVSIHTVTAFLFAGLGGRPFWNTTILGPRFIASAFASGPAFIVLTLQIIRNFTDYRIHDSALLMLRKLIQVAMIVTVFLFLNEFFVEFYAESLHIVSMQYLFFGLHGYHSLVPWIWTAEGFNLIALIILMLPVSQNIKYLNIACILVIVGIWIEKGMGLIIPGFIPTPLGEVVEYFPSLNEIFVCIGVWAFGFLIYTILLKLSIPILLGRFRIRLKYEQNRI